MSKTGINSYVRRVWLNPETSLHTSYIMAHVENSQGGTNTCGSNVIWIADCNRVVQLEFFLGNNKEDREASIAKINLLLEIFGEFRDALIQESFLIAKSEKNGLTVVEPSERVIEEQPEIQNLRDAFKRAPLWQIRDCLDSYESITRELRETLESVIGATSDKWLAGEGY